MPISEERKKVLRKKIAKARTTEAPENAVGQWIAGFFEAGVSHDLSTIIENLPQQEFTLRLPEEKKTWRLKNKYGESRQIDYVISDNDNNPVVVIEDKWLKDQRHLKDKGSWITALEAVQDSNSSVRGILAVLAGEWNEATLKALRKIAYVFPIPTQTVYSNLAKIGIQVRIDKKREAYEDPEGLLNNILDVVESKLGEDIDIMVEVGRKITKGIKNRMETTIKGILFPKDPEISERYEVSIRTTWGRIKRIEGKCMNKNPDELIRNIRKRIEASISEKEIEM
jgi:hypothetical protein